MPDDPRNWETTARREVLDRRPWLRVWSEDVRLPDGRVIADFSTIEMPDFVMVVALTEEGLVVAERNYKHGPRRVGLHLPAGYVEPGEDPLLAAQRELLEETDYAAAEWTPLGTFVNDGNRGSGSGFYFLARGAREAATPDAGDLEEIEVVLLPLATLLAATRTGEVAVLSTAAALGLAKASLDSQGRGAPSGS
jgi:ADP-ribose pyrophosphatase